MHVDRFNFFVVTFCVLAWVWAAIDSLHSAVYEISSGWRRPAP